MADPMERSRPTESGRKDQDAQRGTVHGQPRSGHYAGIPVQPFKEDAPEAFGNPTEQSEVE